MTKNELLSYIENNMFNKNKQWKSTAYFYHIYNDLIKYQSEGDSFVEKLYLFYYNKTIQMCSICGDRTKFVKLSQGYRKYCSSRCAANSLEKKEKTKQTNLKNHGVEYITQTKWHKIAISEKYLNNKQNIELARLKRKQTNLKKYGVENISQIEQIKNKFVFKNWKNGQYENRQKAEKTKLKTLYNKYISLTKQTNIIPLFKFNDFLGVQHQYSWQCKECKYIFSHHLLYAFIPHCPNCHPKTRQISNQEKELASWIKQHGYNILENNKNILEGLEIDIYLPDYKLAIEYNGLYWHSTKFKNKYYHQNKVKIAQEKGIRMLHIWENEWLENKELIKDKIHYYINNLQQEIVPKEPELHNIYDNLIWI